MLLLTRGASKHRKMEKTMAENAKQHTSVASDASNSQQPPVAKQPKSGRVLKDMPKGKIRRTLGEGETRERTLECVSENVVKASFTYKRTQSASEEYVVTSEFDYSDCTREDILKLASSTVRIIVQSRLRNMGDAGTYENSLARVNVKHDVVNAARVPADDTMKDIRFAMRILGCDEAGARAFLAEQLAKRANGAA